jgi:hypothetical protein
MLPTTGQTLDAVIASFEAADPVALIAWLVATTLVGSCARTSVVNA